MSSLVRQLKLHGLVGEKAPTNVLASRIIAFFKEFFDGMVIESIPEVKGGVIFFHKNGTCYMEQSENSVWLNCLYDGYWKHLRDFGLEYEEEQLVIFSMVEKELKKRNMWSSGMQLGEPDHFWLIYGDKVEKYLKQKNETPNNG